MAQGLLTLIKGKTIAQAGCLRVGEMPNPPGGRGQKSIFAFPGFVTRGPGGPSSTPSLVGPSTLVVFFTDLGNLGPNFLKPCFLNP